MPNDATNHGADVQRHGQSSTRRGFLIGALALGGVATCMCDPTSAGVAEPVKGGVPVNPRLFTFVGGKFGGWTVVSAKAVVGDPLPAVDRVDIVTGAVAALPDGGKWMLRGVTSNDRYVTRSEKDHLVRTQAALGRADSTHAALIPIRKSAKWWALTQDERRAIFEERSRHNAIGIKYLPGIARRLHHCRDLSEAEPFDFLTLFDYAKGDAGAFDDLVAALRATEEWKYVEREVDIRLLRVS
jgi:Chlorite dismutase